MAWLWNEPGFPHKGWECVWVDDLKGDTWGSDYEHGICAACGNNGLRYVHHLRHPEWEDIEVGCICASKLEEDYNAPVIRQLELVKKAGKRQRQLKREAKEKEQQRLWDIEQQREAEEEREQQRLWDIEQEREAEEEREQQRLWDLGAPERERVEAKRIKDARIAEAKRIKDARIAEAKRIEDARIAKEKKIQDIAAEMIRSVGLPESNRKLPPDPIAYTVEPVEPHYVPRRYRNWLTKDWRFSQNGNPYLNVEGYNVGVFLSDVEWRYWIKAGEKFVGNSRRYSTPEEAKCALYDEMEKIMKWNKITNPR